MAILESQEGRVIKELRSKGSELLGTTGLYNGRNDAAMAIFFRTELSLFGQSDSLTALFGFYQCAMELAGQCRSLSISIEQAKKDGRDYPEHQIARVSALLTCLTLHRAVGQSDPLNLEFLHSYLRSNPRIDFLVEHEVVAVLTAVQELRASVLARYRGHVLGVPDLLTEKAAQRITDRVESAAVSLATAQAAMYLMRILDGLESTKLVGTTILEFKYSPEQLKDRSDDQMLVELMPVMKAFFAARATWMLWSRSNKKDHIEAVDSALFGSWDSPEAGVLMRWDGATLVPMAYDTKAPKFLTQMKEVFARLHVHHQVEILHLPS